MRRPPGSTLGVSLLAIALTAGALTAGAADARAAPRRGGSGAESKRRGSSSADVRVANDLYTAGLEHVKAGEWESARQAFSRAYELYPQPVILANLAGAEVRTGRLVSGVEHYRQLLKDPSGMSAEEIGLLERAMRASEARLAHVRIVVVGHERGDRVELDGVPLAAAALDIDYPVDPGRHVVTAARAGWETAEVEVSLAEGATKRVRLAPRLLATSSARAGWPADSDGKGRGVTSSPWFWIATGVVVVGAAAATICIAAVCRDDPSFQGNLGSVRLP